MLQGITGVVHRPNVFSPALLCLPHIYERHAALGECVLLIGLRKQQSLGHCCAEEGLTINFLRVLLTWDSKREFVKAWDIA